jgi:site-specific DNA-methyltransferase (adenine-specific)
MRKEVIGTATVYLGDCREIVPGLAYDSIITDPPYGMNYQSNFRGVQHAKIANDDQVDLFLWACILPVRHSRYVFCRWDGIKVAPLPKSCVTWIKNNWSMGDLEHEHARQTEVALFWPGSGHKFPTSRPTDVVQAPRTANEHHPTEKPVYLMEHFVRWTEGVVLDPFMGSGSTGLACLNLGRPFVGVELEQKYFDTACKRLEDGLRQERLFA